MTLLGIEKKSLRPKSQKVIAHQHALSSDPANIEVLIPLVTQWLSVNSSLLTNLS